MRSEFLHLVLALLCMALCSCRNGIDSLLGESYDIDRRAEFRDMIPSSSIPEKYAVIVISDLHLEEQGNGDMEDFISCLSAYPFAADSRPRFCIVMGDIAENGYKAEYEVYLNFRSRLEAMGMQVLSTPGNHDTYASGNYGKNYMKVIGGSTFYRMRAGNVSFYVLDTADGTLGYEQLHTLEEKLGKDDSRKLVFSHYPPYSSSANYSMLNSTESAKLLSLYAKSGVELVFSGHTHAHEEREFGSFRSVTVGSIVRDNGRRNFAILFVNGGSGSFRLESVDF